MDTGKSLRKTGIFPSEEIPSCPHNALLEIISRNHARSRPLRSNSVWDALWEGIQNDDISMVSSDDAAYSWDAKLSGSKRFDKCPNGIPGIEPRLKLLCSEGVAKGKLSLPRFFELIATAPAVGACAIPNLIAVLALSGVFIKLMRD